MNLFKSFRLLSYALALLCLSALFSACTQLPHTQPSPITQPVAAIKTSQELSAPDIPREFRAAWVASIGNIDWPSRKNLSVAQQKNEMLAILDNASKLKLNAIILQVRPAADALYASDIEPWSEYLNGEQGKPPKPYYDPLALWIEEAHARGLELHAWFNPFRAKTTLKRTVLAANHISKLYPSVVKTYGDQLWMDPAEPAAVQQSLAVIEDVVRRYDIDGVHLDDYFYPYPISVAGKEQDFPDDVSWQRYLSQGGTLKRADWRRQQISQFVRELYTSIHQIKPWIRLGISPFGIGRSDRLPAGISGFNQYEQLYADVETWLQSGWVDYLAPQLYWPITQSQQAFPVLLDYWSQQNTLHRLIIPGLYTGRLDQNDNAWSAEEIINQIKLTRQNPGISGHIHFSMSSLQRNSKGISSLLQGDIYQQAAITPAMPWLGKSELAKPELQLNPLSETLTITDRDMDIRSFAIWKKYAGIWRFSAQSSTQREISLQDDPELGPLQMVQISAIDHFGSASPPASYTCPAQ